MNWEPNSAILSYFTLLFIVAEQFQIFFGNFLNLVGLFWGRIRRGLKPYSNYLHSCSRFRVLGNEKPLSPPSPPSAPKAANAVPPADS